MRYIKQPTSITEQINLLKLRGLIIDNEAEAKAVQERISYFRLFDEKVLILHDNNS